MTISELKKPWYKSKTLWINLVVGVFASLEASTGLLQPYLPEYWYVIIAVGLPVINVILRVVTTQGLTIK